MNKFIFIKKLREVYSTHKDELTCLDQICIMCGSYFQLYFFFLLQMTVDFAAKQIFSGDLENAPFNISDMFRDLVEGLMSFPINLPGTSHHKCLQVTQTSLLSKQKTAYP